MPRQPPSKPKRRAPNTGSVIVRKDGRIAVVLPPDLDPHRRPIYSPGRRIPWTSVEQATAWLDAEARRLRNPTPRAATLSEPLGAYLERWWRLYAPGWPQRTARAYRRRVLLFVSIGDVRLGDLTHEVVMSAISGLQTATWRRRKRSAAGMVPYGPGHPYAPSTIRAARATLHQALDHLVPAILPANPVRRIKLGRTQEQPQRVWDANQADRFLQTVDRLRPDLSFPCRLLLRRALRRGEVLAIRRADIDWRRRIVTISSTAGDRAGETDDTKGRQIRDIPLGELEEAARRHVRDYRLSVWLVPGRTTDKPLSLRQFSVTIDQLIAAAGLPRITPKDMRATAATLLLDRGMALPRVAFLLGHSNVATTAKFYQRALRVTQARVDELAAELDQAFRRDEEMAERPGIEPGQV